MSSRVAWLGALALLLGACDGGGSNGGGTAGTGGGAGGSAGTGGASGAAGTADTGGTGGSSAPVGTGGAGGSAGAAGTTGAAGTGGAAAGGTTGGAAGSGAAGTGGGASGGRGGTGGASGGRGGTGGAAAGGRGGTGGGAVGGGNGSWQLLAPMPGGARQEHCVAALGGLVYAIGSYNGSAMVGTVPGNQRLEAYDPATNTWSTKAMMPFGGDHCNAAATATKLYVLGATGTTQSAEYDPVANSWTMKRPIPTQRAAAATAAIGDKIYVAGGMSTMGRNVTVREFAAYDAVTDTWEILPDLPEIQRNHGPGAGVGGIFYLLGGRSGPPNNPTEGLLDRVDAYDPATRMWSSKAPMPRARGGTSAGVIGGLIVVVGGEGNNVAVNSMRVFPETDVFDPVANSWRTVAPMRTPRHGMGAGVVGNVLYVPGGATAQGGGTAVAILEAFSF